MAKPNKAAIKEALERWARAKAKELRVVARRDGELEPITAAYNKRCAAIHEKANEELRPVQEELKNLEAKIAKEFAFGVDLENRTCALYQAATEKAIAEMQTSEGNREVAAEKFFDQVPASRRDSKFWECLKVQIGKAEKFLGSVIDTIAEKPWSAEVVIRLKD